MYGKLRSNHTLKSVFPRVSPINKIFWHHFFFFLWSVFLFCFLCTSFGASQHPSVLCCCNLTLNHHPFLCFKCGKSIFTVSAADFIHSSRLCHDGKPSVCLSVYLSALQPQKEMEKKWASKKIEENWMESLIYSANSFVNALNVLITSCSAALYMSWPACPKNEIPPVQER